MKIREVEERTPRLVEQLVDVWEASVRATHLFLSANEIAEIKRYVPQALMGVAHLVVAERDDGAPAAFMGVQDGKLEMLFLAPEERGKAAPGAWNPAVCGRIPGGQRAEPPGPGLL